MDCNICFLLLHAFDRADNDHVVTLKVVLPLELIDEPVCNLSKTEAEEIASRRVNQDGTKGAHWNIDEFKAVVESLNAQMSNPPFYNGYALWVTANMLYSDHAKSAVAYVPAEDLPKYFYTMAVEQLKDPDRSEFVRAYFKV